MRKYSQEFIKNVLAEYKKEENIKKIVSTFGVPKSTLFHWIKNNKTIVERETKKFVTYGQYKKLQNELSRTKLLYEIYEKLHCFKDASILEKEVAISKFFGVYPTKVMCKVLDLPHGTFYNYIFRRKEVKLNQLRDEELKTEIMKIYLESERRFGANKIVVKLKLNGIKTTLRKVQMLMKELDIRSTQKLQKKEMKNPNNYYYVNKLQRLFNQDAPNKFWVSDVTEVKVGLTKFYLCVILDLFSRKVIAYRLSSQNNTNLTINTFKDAFEDRNRPAELSFHSDQGTNYTAVGFRDLLRTLKVNQSFSHPGNPYDNACMESFFSNFKREEYNTKEYEFFEDLEISVDSYMKYYNEYRPHKSLKYKTPNQLETEFYENLTAKKPQISL